MQSHLHRETAQTLAMSGLGDGVERAWGIGLRKWGLKGLGLRGLGSLEVHGFWAKEIVKGFC